jgi:hypothetical protein
MTIGLREITEFSRRSCTLDSAAYVAQRLRRRGRPTCLPLMVGGDVLACRRATTGGCPYNVGQDVMDRFTAPDFDIAP